MPKVRRDAAEMVRKGYSKEEVGRRFGVGSSTIHKWVAKAEKYKGRVIPTLSSKPKRHPNQLSDDTVWKIFKKRLERNRCAEVVHQELANDGVSASLSSVKRTLDREGLLKKRSPWKRYHPPVDRPYPIHPGDLVQLDTIHLMTGPRKRINDNAHIERFNRTLQEECLDKVPSNPKDINCALRKYLRYHNHERLHLGINLKTPSQLTTQSVQAIG